MLVQDHAHDGDDGGQHRGARQRGSENDLVSHAARQARRIRCIGHYGDVARHNLTVEKGRSLLFQPGLEGIEREGLAVAPVLESAGMFCTNIALGEWV